eukprot:scaffold6866_cov118-Isochrysis_galbana.AAC.11
MSAVFSPRIKAPRPTDSNVWSTVPKYSSCSVWVWCCGRSDCSGGSAKCHADTSSGEVTLTTAAATNLA